MTPTVSQENISRQNTPELKAFVVGHPISHSRSPQIHQFWIKQHGLNATYEAIDVSPENMLTFMNRLKSGEFVGGNVTIPHKQTIMGFCDELSGSSTSIGAVNTLRRTNGLIVGSNSDHFGFVDNLDQQAPGWSHRLQRAIVLGAGGAARAIVYALLKRGVSEIIVLNRTLKNASRLAQHFGDTVTVDQISNFSYYAPETKLVVNTTSVGLNGTRFEHLVLNKLPRDALVNDIVYTPLVTPLLAQATNLELKTVDGLGMLLHQAIPGFEMWFGIRPEVTPSLRTMIEQQITGS